MKKLILIFIISIITQNTVQCQYLQNPVLSTIDNRKEIRTYYEEDYMRDQQYFDRKGNLFFSKTYNRKGEVLAITYNEYTDKNELAMIISTSTISDLSLHYLDYSKEGVVKNCYSSIWNRDLYDPRTKEFLQEVTTVENLLNHKQVRKLMKKRRKCEWEIYLDSKGRKVKEIFRRKKRKIISVRDYEYDESNNLMNSTHINIKKNIKEESKVLNKYDDSGNRIKSTYLKLTQKNNGEPEQWIVVDSTQTKYNNHNQRIEHLSTFSRGEKTNSETKTTYLYDDNHRLINKVSYNKKGEKQYEHKYDYKNKRTIHFQSINYDQLSNNPEYKPTSKIFEIKFYDD